MESKYDDDDEEKSGGVEDDSASRSGRRRVRRERKSEDSDCSKHEAKTRSDGDDYQYATTDAEVRFTAKAVRSCPPMFHNRRSFT